MAGMDFGAFAPHLGHRWVGGKDPTVLADYEMRAIGDVNRVSVSVDTVLGALAA